MRAFLLLTVLGLWALCVGGAIGFTGYLAWLTLANLRGLVVGPRRVAPSRPHWTAMVLMLGLSLLMFAIALLGMWLAAPDESSGCFTSTSGGSWVECSEASGSSAFFLMPLWCSTATAATAVVVSTRRPARQVGEP